MGTKQKDMGKQAKAQSAQERADRLSKELTQASSTRDALAEQLVEHQDRVKGLTSEKLDILASGDESKRDRVKVLRSAILEAEDATWEAQALLVRVDDNIAALERAAEGARRDLMRAKLDALAPEEARAAANLQAALKGLAKAAQRATGVRAEADAHRRALDLPVPRIDATTNAILAGLVRLNIVDSRAINIPLHVLRALDPTEQAERQRVAELERQAAERSELSRRPTVLRHERERVLAKLDEWGAVFEKDRSRHAQRRVAEEEARLAEIDAELAELEPTKAEALIEELRRDTASDELAPAGAWREAAA